MSVVFWPTAKVGASETSLAAISTAVLPPLPDLPIPGSTVKVNGRKGSGNEGSSIEARSKPPEQEPELKPEDLSRVGVFQADRALELVY